MFLAANDVPKAKRVPMLLSVIGTKTFILLYSLFAPQLLTKQHFKELVSVLKKHFEPKTLIIAERFHFNCRIQAPDESMAGYVAELCRLSVHCEFWPFLNDALRDRFICSLRSELVQRQLLAEDKLTLARVLEIAQGMESADKH